MMRYNRLIILLLALLQAWPLTAFAQDEAQDLTAQAVITVSAKAFSMERLRDRDYTTQWIGEGRNKSIHIQSDAALYGLYICFSQEPRAWILEEYLGDTWQTTTIERSNYQHQYVALKGTNNIRIKPEGKNQKWFSVSELFVYGEGAVPSHVQRWQEPAARNDMMIFFAHPDDEALFFGGAIPTYAGQRQLDVVAVCLNDATPVRKTELLNSLWTMGLRTYPVFGPFYDAYSLNLAKAYQHAGENKAKRFAVGIFRQFKPSVVITHDQNGEYGHGMHRMCAATALYAFDVAADPERFSDSAQAYGAFQVSKLYLHLYPENTIVMDWDVPLPFFAGRTGFEMAQEAYQHHRTQHRYEQYQVEPRDSKYSSYHFGLAKTNVGPDVLKNDLMENVGF